MNILSKDFEMQEISDNNASAIREIFGRDKALIGMIHCPAFPGAPRYRGVEMSTIYDACMRDAEALVEGGMHGLMIENHGDVPFSKPEDIGCETAAFMSVVTDRIAIAMAGGAKFIRVNQWANAYVANEGFMEGRAAEAMRYRSALRAEHIKVFADSHVKHGSHAIVADRSIAELTRDLAFFDADGIIATGQRTGNAATIEEIEEIAAATHLPLLVGSGVDKTNVVEILKRTSGVIVASSLKVEGVWWNPVDIERVRAFRAASEPALGA
jgi:hypothetical protein